MENIDDAFDFDLHELEARLHQMPLSAVRDIHQAATDFLAKAKQRPRIDPRHLHPKAVIGNHKLRAALSSSFHKQRDRVVDLIKEHFSHVKKADEFKSPEELASYIYEQLKQYFDALPAETEGDILDAVQGGVENGLAQLSIDDSEVINTVNSIARDWAQNRAAEMVGMRRTESGELVPNPNAEWVISDTTRDDLKRIIVDAFEKETKMDDLVGAIQNSGMFSEARADMIARTEVSFAQTTGNYEVWQASGAVAGTRWVLSEDHEIPCDCEDNEDQVAEIGEAFPSGALMPPEHPNCWCILVAVFPEDMKSEDEETAA